MIAKKSERMRSLFFEEVLMDVAFVGSKGPYQASGTAESGELGSVGVGGGRGLLLCFSFWNEHYWAARSKASILLTCLISSPKGFFRLYQASGTAESGELGSVGVGGGRGLLLCFSFWNEHYWAARSKASILLTCLISSPKGFFRLLLRESIYFWQDLPVKSSGAQFL